MDPGLPIDASASWENFCLYFVKKSGFSTLRALAAQGELGKLGIRTHSWRIFLGIFPESSSLEQNLEILHKSRSNYALLKSSFQFADPLLGNSLIIKLRADISKDVSRTFTNHRFFAIPHTQETIISILSIWTATHNLGYFQGMSEIAAIVYLQVTSEKYEDPKNILHQFNDPRSIESDTYQIFERMFEVGMQGMYMKEKQEKNKNLFMNFMQEVRNMYTKEDILENPVVKNCHDVFEVYLKIVDPELFEFLVENGIEAHLFML